jgi:hypothetical protein
MCPPGEAAVTRKVLGAQNVSRMCLVCGVENTAGFNARFFELDGGELAGVFRPREEHQGYPGRLHGGWPRPFWTRRSAGRSTSPTPRPGESPWNSR